MDYAWIANNKLLITWLRAAEGRYSGSKLPKTRAEASSQQAHPPVYVGKDGRIAGGATGKGKGGKGNEEEEKEDEGEVKKEAEEKQEPAK